MRVKARPSPGQAVRCGRCAASFTVSPQTARPAEEALLLASQDEDGHWSTNSYPDSSPTIDTCFALLFLNKANFVPGLAEGLQEYIKVRDPG
jgi:hypothetical protein